MFRSNRSRERAALAPLVALARAQRSHERRAWLDDLRTDAPTVAARIETMLAESEAGELDAEATPGTHRDAPDHEFIARDRSTHAAPARTRYVAPALAVGGLQR